MNATPQAALVEAQSLLVAYAILCGELSKGLSPDADEWPELRELGARFDRFSAALAQAEAAQQVEPLTRFCPGCGSVGPVPAEFRDCCPDGGHARMVPESLAQRCHDLFQVALRAPSDPDEVLAAPQPAKAAEQPAPDPDAQERAHNAGFVEASRLHGAEIERLRAEVAAALPAMREYAARNPCWTAGDGPTQDPNGAHAWLARNGA